MVETVKWFGKRTQQSLLVGVGRFGVARTSTKYASVKAAQTLAYHQSAMFPTNDLC